MSCWLLIAWTTCAEDQPDLSVPLCRVSGYADPVRETGPDFAFGEVPSRVVGDPGKHVGNVELRIDPIELGAFDQRVRRRRAPAAAGVSAFEPANR
jgi:hypothetical protein